MPLADIPIDAHTTIPASEVSVEFVRSSGPGGQHVNKTSTQAQIRWRPDATRCLNDVQKTRIRSKLASRLTLAGELLIACDKHRSRERNLTECLDRLSEMIRSALTVPKRRRPTRPTRGSQERRMDAKRRRSQTKRLRRPPE